MTDTPAVTDAQPKGAGMMAYDVTQEDRVLNVMYATSHGFYSEAPGQPLVCEPSGFRAPYGSNEWLADLDQALFDAQLLLKYPNGTRMETDEQLDEVINSNRAQKAIASDSIAIIYTLRNLLAIERGDHIQEK